VYHLIRYAAKDDILPLSEPIITTTGEAINEIPVGKGQGFLIDICLYNRYEYRICYGLVCLTSTETNPSIKSIWGEDADQFNPMRFIDGRVENAVKVGMYGNL
jgi:alkylphenol/PAH-inducible cytochrome P450 monooxygenase